ncbi:IS3 family transposase [Francisella tularensis]|uniref:IS3 family transposase n=1 Tax=Francisella tularensis TaxID=263 RepID=UPI000AA75F90
MCDYRFISIAVIGWSMDSRMKADLVCSALNMALFRRNFPRGVIIHSDKGSQYCSKQFQDIVKDNWLLSSMSSKGCCYDNAACESFFGTLKVELVHDENYKTREEAKSSIFEYIEAYYNTKRKHSTINYMTPNQFEYIMENEVANCPKLTG